MLPWNLYNLTPRDQGSPLIRPFWYRYNTVIAGPTTGVVGDVNIPDEMVLLCTMVNIASDNAAGVALDYLGFFVSDTGSALPQANFEHRMARGAGTSPNVMDSYTWTGSPLFMMHAHEYLEWIVNLSGAATNIDVNVGVAGFLIPRGTLSIT